MFLIICDVGRFSAVPISGLMISFNLFSWLRAAAASVAINNSWLNYMRNQPDHSYCKVPLGTPFNAGWKRNHHLVVAPKVGDSNDGFFVFVFLSTRRAILASTLQIKITRSVHSPPSIEHAFARWSRETPNRQRLALSHRRQPLLLLLRSRGDRWCMVIVLCCVVSGDTWCPILCRSAWRRARSKDNL